jgi:ATP-binding cassette subfamily B protein
VLNTYREAEASLESFQEILDTPIEPVPVSPVPVEHIDRVTFDCAAFQYHSAAKPSLRDVSFEVQRGETVAFVGPSGSGKTTLVKLLVGLYPPHRGRVLYNEHLGSEIDLNQLREHIGLVTQDTQLFAGTIRENLLFVRPGATDEECLDVLHKAAAQGLLARAENGLDTVIGEGGVKVSGGERQRLSIARALLRHPDLLVFDEATSSLDSLTEDRVSETIREISRREDMIVILIAHRLSTVMHADRIYVLERGYVVESGTHADLVEAKGLYYAMWRQQTGERQEGEVEILDPDKGEQLDVPAERASTPMTVG